MNDVQWFGSRVPTLDDIVKSDRDIKDYADMSPAGRSVVDANRKEVSSYQDRVAAERKDPKAQAAAAAGVAKLKQQGETHQGRMAAGSKPGGKPPGGGWAPIGSHGGVRKRGAGGKWTYWYPSKDHAYAHVVAMESDGKGSKDEHHAHARAYSQGHMAGDPHTETIGASMERTSASNARMGRIHLEEITAGTTGVLRGRDDTGAFSAKVDIIEAHGRAGGHKAVKVLNHHTGKEEWLASGEVESFTPTNTAKAEKSEDPMKDNPFNLLLKSVGVEYVEPEASEADEFAKSEDAEVKPDGGRSELTVDEARSVFAKSDTDGDPTSPLMAKNGLVMVDRTFDAACANMIKNGQVTPGVQHHSGLDLAPFSGPKNY